MRYVDGFLLVVPKKGLKKYAAIARKAGEVWMDHGALAYVETAGDDLAVKCGLPFGKRVQAKAGEVVVFSWIVYRSRAHRDRVNRKVMHDPRIRDAMTGPMPFDLGRMSFGGFRTLVDL